ncbi:hypothetical protein PV327_003175 [Microctonus hyperodae]|uniref:Uncharacterized protein n=1 Tax=Microctonus hyperodae TaxID=165561 RepID=A0AA39L0X3_MICHY|nr:hypothetical protein PV327_003175 [Microctonus hyperodae]
MMEISKGLRKEIMLVQNKLKNAIRDHQICMGKLKDNSNNADILGQIEEIRLHIISLGRCQKQVVQRLRKEVEAFKAENVNGAKLSIASLLGLNNNNNSNHNNNNNSNANKNNNANSNKSKNNEHVAVDENDEQEDIVQVKVKQNGVVDNRRLCKENYEEVVRNGIDASSQEKICAKERSRSVEVLPTEADVIEVSDDENTCENSDSVGRLEEIEETSSSEQSELNSKQVIFLGNLALITASKFSELQHKRAERKRRSTANPQFVYSNWDIPTKRKRHAYLQSVGNAPQTRQTTARLNGPSPPPSKISSSKSTSPSTKSSKSLMLIQKSTSVRPNILRNISESIELSNKTQLENGISDMPIPDSKSSQVKTMHIPGLPSCLTIERIESDTAVCVYCRNPGTLTYCDDCPVSYHASCRSSSPPPVRLCSKCVQNQKDDDRTQTPVIKKDEEIAAASSAPGVVDKAGENTEVNKTSGGFYQINPTPSSQFITTNNYGVNQLPISTYLIPISSRNVTNSTVSHPTDQQSNSANDTNITNPIDIKHINDTCINNITCSPLIINQQHDNRRQLSFANIQTTEKQQQSFLVIKKISDPSVGGIVSYQQQHSNQYPQLNNYSYSELQNPTTNYKLPIFESRERQNDPVSAASHVHDQLASSSTESTIRNKKKSTTRTIPGLKPITSTEKSSVNKIDDSVNRRTLELSTSTTTKVRNECHESKVTGAIGHQSIDLTDSQCSQSKKSKTNKLGPNSDINQSNHYTKSGNLLNALLSSNYKSNNITNCNDKSSGEKFNNLPPGSIADRLYRRLSEDQSCMRGTGESIAKFNEYVKLEEAHLSAPSPTNLVQYKLIDKNDRDLILSRSKSCPIIDIMTYEKRDIPRILMRNGRRSLDSLKKISRKINISENHDTIVERAFRCAEDKDEILSNKPDCMDFNILEDTLTATEGEFDDNDDDDDEATDSPDDIEYDKIASNIDMQVLEAFESAMMKEVNRDDTAN